MPGQTRLALGKIMKKSKKIIIFILIFFLWSFIFSFLDLTVERGLCGCPNIGDFPPGAMVDCACSIFLGRPFYGNHDFWTFIAPIIILVTKILLSLLISKIFFKIFAKK